MHLLVCLGRDDTEGSHSVRCPTTDMVFSFILLFLFPLLGSSLGFGLSLWDNGTFVITADIQLFALRFFFFFF